MSQLQPPIQQQQSSQQPPTQQSGFRSGGQGAQQPIQQGQPMQGQMTQQPQQSMQGQMAQQMGGGGASQAVGQFFFTQNYLPENVRQTSATTLGQCLADATDLLSQVRTAHWNVKGPEFYQLHELFEEIAEDLEDDIDDIAERATALGATVSGTVRTSAATTRIPELPREAVDGLELVELLADRFATFDAILGDAIRSAHNTGDLDTADLLNDVSREVSESLWLLEAHLQRSGTSMQTGPTSGQAGGAQSTQMQSFPGQ